MIEEDVEILEGICSRLRPISRQSVIHEDMFEAADDWRILGEALLQSGPWVDLRMLAKQNEEQLNGMRVIYGLRLAEHPDFADILAIGARLIGIGKARVPDGHGYLKCNDFIRQSFAFLCHDFSMKPWTNEFGDGGYATDQIVVVINALPILPTSHGPVELSTTNRPNGRYGLADVAFMVDRNAPLEPPPLPEITTQEEAQALCTDILANKPGAFERLVQAAEDRDRLLGEEYDRLYGEGSGSLIVHAQRS